MNWKINLSSLKPFGVRYIFWLADVTLVLKVSTHSTIKNNMKKCNLVIFRVYCCFGLQFWICVKKKFDPSLLYWHFLDAKLLSTSRVMASYGLSMNLLQVCRQFYINGNFDIINKWQVSISCIWFIYLFRPWSSRMVNFENNKQNLIYACYGK